MALISSVGLLDKPTERERIGSQGRDLVISGFTYDRAVARILEDVGRVSKKNIER